MHKDDGLSRKGFDGFFLFDGFKFSPTGIETSPCPAKVAGVEEPAMLGVDVLLNTPVSVDELIRPELLSPKSRSG